MEPKIKLTHEERVELYTHIIVSTLKGPLTDFNVAYMRNKAPTQASLDALNEALAKMGWTK